MDATPAASPASPAPAAVSATPAPVPDPPGPAPGLRPGATGGRAHSLRRRLLGFLIIAIVAGACAQAAVAYRAALAEADAIFDYHMQQTATSLGAGLPAAAVAAPPGNEVHDNFDFIVQVWTRDGLQIFQSAPRARLPQLAILGFADVAARGTTYRVLSLQTATQTIQVAQDLSVRRELARGLAWRTVTPVLALAPLLMLVVWWVVRASLAPVARVQAQVAARAAGDLSPVDPAGLPDEVQPLVREINLLFGRVQRAFDAQTHFVADAAHELRSPLAALKLQLQGLQRSTDPATREVAVGRLAAGVDRATRLVEQLLALARAEANAPRDGGAAAPVDLVEAARQAVADAVPRALERGTELALEAPLPVVVAGQAEALRMLVRNLVENAVVHTPAGGRVEVTVQAQALGQVDDAWLTVEDSGPGIPEDERERVLDRFHRIAGSPPGGSGLGLAIVRTIATAHGASLRLDRSPTLGGLRVELRFPPSGGGSTSSGTGQ